MGWAVKKKEDLCRKTFPNWDDDGRFFYMKRGGGPAKESRNWRIREGGDQKEKNSDLTQGERKKSREKEDFLLT